MAHRLSSSLYDDGNKMSKGQVIVIFLKIKKKIKKIKKYFFKKNYFCGIAGDVS